LFSYRSGHANEFINHRVHSCSDGVSRREQILPLVRSVGVGVVVSSGSEGERIDNEVELVGPGSGLHLGLNDLTLVDIILSLRRLVLTHRLLVLPLAGNGPPPVAVEPVVGAPITPVRPPVGPCALLRGPGLRRCDSAALNRVSSGSVGGSARCCGVEGLESRAHRVDVCLSLGVAQAASGAVGHPHGGPVEALADGGAGNWLGPGIDAPAGVHGVGKAGNGGTVGPNGNGFPLSLNSGCCE
jgi:hypothetical protein